MHLQIFDCNSKYCIYNFYHFFTNKMEKIGHVRFLPKVLNVFFIEKKRFDCKNHHKRGKLADFQLNNIRKINCRILVVILYVLLGLKLRKI